jgi:hypothetical protein
MRHPYFSLLRCRLAVNGRILDEVRDLREAGAKIGTRLHVGKISEPQALIDQGHMNVGALAGCGDWRGAEPPVILLWGGVQADAHN